MQMNKRNKNNNYDYHKNTTHPLALKTLRYEHKYTERNVDRHRRDAVAMERLSSSPNILDIYAFCGHTGIFEFAPGGDLKSAIAHNDSWTNQEKLQVSYQVASALADVHSVGSSSSNNKKTRKFASIAHTDISLSQYVRVSASDLHFKLNDFNRARFLRWDTKLQKPCGFFVSNNAGTFRSPEEYAYVEETEKVDVYSIGNIFYTILHGKRPFEHESTSKAKKMVMNGKRAPIDDDFLSSSDPFLQTIINAITLCWEQDPNSRASAQQVAQYIGSQLQRHLK